MILEELLKYLVSVGGGVVGGFLVQWFWVRKANESAVIEYLTKELTDLVDETLEYWSLDCSQNDKDSKANRLRSRMLEQKIKGAIKNLSSVLRQYSQRYCKSVDFQSLMVEVSDACTCGDFEVLDRTSDPDRFLNVINATNRVRFELLKRRV